MLKKHIAPLIIAAATLSGCASLTPSTLTAQQKQLHQRPAIQQTALLQALTHWQIEGAFSLSQGAKHIIANYTWQQRPSTFSLRIYSGLNLASISIKGSDHNITLTNENGQTWHAKSISSLMQKALGWQLPINGLVYWIKGLPAPGKHSTQINTTGNLKTLTQNGWQINYQRYQRADIYDLPNIITIQGHQTHIKLVIKRWKLNKKH
jgi:outer membrane lipoprotein LolB